MVQILIDAAKMMFFGAFIITIFILWFAFLEKFVYMKTKIPAGLIFIPGIYCFFVMVVVVASFFKELI